MQRTITEKKGFGHAPVYFTAISTIFGAILFLRFGFATGTLGFWGVFLIVLLGHLVTIPTALAISELATNKRVEGGGEYFIISRSFGLNIGSTIGISLYLSQAISVAFYVIAFTEAFQFVFDYFSGIGIELPRQVVSLPSILLLSALILSKGANLGVKALYYVVGILVISIIAFFAGSTDYKTTTDTFSLNISNPDMFFVVFAIAFPAFTGMTAGVGLSGDLRSPSKSIPIGTIGATLTGLVVYIFIIYKLSISASSADLRDNQLIMSQIALGGFVLIPLGLAASTISSAIGSVMVAPRTLQALAKDSSFPSKKLNNWLAKSREKDGEPFNASIVTCTIAVIFVSLGNVNAVAEIISMFFLVTYGSLSLISFLHHFGSSPSYRPTFKSRWYISLTGFLLAAWVMFQINTAYALFAIIIMILIHLYLSNYHKDRSGIESIFANSIYQLNRNLQVALQKSGQKIADNKKEWRPSAICFSSDSFERISAFNVLNWISYKYGFGTYIHLIKGYFGKSTRLQSKEIQKRLISLSEKFKSKIYVDTIISPSYTSAVSQTIQIKGIAGMENNMVIFEFDKEKRDNLTEILENISLVRSGDFDILLVGSSRIQKLPGDEIHIWINVYDTENANLMIMLGYIISGHPEWKKSDIRIFEVTKAEKYSATKEQMDNLLNEGRLPITEKNIEIIILPENQSIKELINKRSTSAGLTILGFRGEKIKDFGAEKLSGFEQLKTVIFVSSKDSINLN